MVPVSTNMPVMGYRVPLLYTNAFDVWCVVCSVKNVYVWCSVRCVVCERERLANLCVVCMLSAALTHDRVINHHNTHHTTLFSDTCLTCFVRSKSSGCF
jgi:hypothetical protein